MHALKAAHVRRNPTMAAPKATARTTLTVCDLRDQVRPGSDVIHRRARRLGLAACGIRDRDRAKLLAHGLDSVDPDRPGPRGLAAQRALERLDHLEHGDLRGRARERIAPLDPALALQDPCSPEGR